MVLYNSIARKMCRSQNFIYKVDMWKCLFSFFYFQLKCWILILYWGVIGRSRGDTPPEHGMSQMDDSDDDFGGDAAGGGQMQVSVEENRYVHFLSLKPYFFFFLFFNQPLSIHCRGDLSMHFSITCWIWAYPSTLAQCGLESLKPYQSYIIIQGDKYAKPLLNHCVLRRFAIWLEFAGSYPA